MSEAEFRGIITKSVGGIYYADALGGSFIGENIKCAARGIFRTKGISPSAGDHVRICVSDNSEPVIAEIEERKNFLSRPPLANLDRVFFVNSTVEPKVNRLILDKLIAVADSKDIEPIIVFTKIDLEKAGNLPDVYRKIGISVCAVDNITGEGADEVRKLIGSGISAFIGNSGVGKSSLLNILFPELNLKTGEISKKLGRGRHTTRQAELFKIGNGYIADTPGFSTVDIGYYCDIPKDELDGAFREFREAAAECRFANCRHVKECGCAVKDAVESGEISHERYDSYLRILEEYNEKTTR
ncbi:MAG: ribosome small subunit-dependent GTPase A [Oscillospiraceae bacterium]|nr:ribosome small subunit-dependent GTPase A [Oscillospiraceae bacterium]